MHVRRQGGKVLQPITHAPLDSVEREDATGNEGEVNAVRYRCPERRFGCLVGMECHDQIECPQIDILNMLAQPRNAGIWPVRTACLRSVR